MDLQLKDKVVVITGGASGIGLVTARTFLGEGAKLVLGDVQDDGLAQVVAELRKQGGSVVGQRVDVREYAQCQV